MSLARGVTYIYRCRNPLHVKTFREVDLIIQFKSTKKMVNYIFFIKIIHDKITLPILNKEDCNEDKTINI